MTAGSPAEKGTPFTPGDPPDLIAATREAWPAATLLLGAALLFYAVPGTIPSAVALLLLAGLAWWRLDLALFLPVVFGPAFMLPKHLGSTEFAPSEIFIVMDVAVAALWTLDMRRRQSFAWQRVVRSPFFWPAVMFVAAAALSTVAAADRHEALRAYREWILEPVAWFGLFLAMSSTACTGLHRRGDPPVVARLRVSRTRGTKVDAKGGRPQGDRPCECVADPGGDAGRAGTRHGPFDVMAIYGLAALLIAGVWTSCLAIGQLILHQDLSTSAGSPLQRVQALYGSPDNLGLLLDGTIPVWLAGAVLLWATWRVARPSVAVNSTTSSAHVQTGRHGHGGPSYGTWLALVALIGAVMLAALLLTYSRGAWVAVLAAAAAVIGMAFRKGRYVLAAGAIVVVVAAAWKGPSVVRALQSGHANTAERRIYIWKSAAHMIRDHPLLGVGPDNFIHYYAPSKDLYSGCSPGLDYMDPAAADEPCLSHPHNAVLDFYLSTGVVGLAVFIWLMVVFWRTALAAYRRLDGVSRAAVLGAMAAMLAALIHGMVDNFYFLPDLSVMFWLLCAVVWRSNQVSLKASR